MAKPRRTGGQPTGQVSRPRRPVNRADGQATKRGGRSWYAGSRLLGLSSQSSPVLVVWPTGGECFQSKYSWPLNSLPVQMKPLVAAGHPRAHRNSCGSANHANRVQRLRQWYSPRLRRLLPAQSMRRLLLLCLRKLLHPTPTLCAYTQLLLLQ